MNNESILALVRRHKILYQVVGKMYDVARIPLNLRRRKEYVKDPHTYWEERGKVYISQDLSSMDCTGERLNEILIEQIKQLSPRTILDVGCGYGRALKLLSESLKPDRLVGVDFSSTQLEAARKYVGDIDVELVHADVTKGLEFGDSAFDLVFSIGVIMHIPPPNQIRAFKEMIRLSKRHILHNEWVINGGGIFHHDYKKFYQEQGHRIVWGHAYPVGYRQRQGLIIIVELNK